MTVSLFPVQWHILSPPLLLWLCVTAAPWLAATGTWRQASWLLASLARMMLICWGRYLEDGKEECDSGVSPMPKWCADKQLHQAYFLHTAPSYPYPIHICEEMMSLVLFNSVCILMFARGKKWVLFSNYTSLLGDVGAHIPHRCHFQHSARHMSCYSMDNSFEVCPISKTSYFLVLSF